MKLFTKNSIVKTLCVILIAVLMVSMFNLVLGFTAVLLPSRDDGIPVGDFGGIEIRKSSFDNNVSDVSATHTNCVVSHSDEYGGSMSVYNSGTDSECHANLLGFTSGMTCSVFSFVMVDFDLILSGLTDTLMVGSTHRNDGGGLVASLPGGSQYLYISPNGKSFDFSVINDGATIQVASISKDSFHLTIVYRYDHDDFTNSDAFVYLDGEYICSFDGFLSSEPNRLSTVRFHQTSTNNVNAPDQFYVDNYSLYGFKAGYDGAISYLFDNTEYTLFECSDSILFEE